MITTLLLDADGVVQLNTGLYGRIDALLQGKATFWDASPVEQRGMTGTVDVQRELQDFLDERGIDLRSEVLLDAWCYTEPDPEAFALVDAVRAHGTPVYLATNQQPVRGRWIRETLGYERHVDGLFVSHEMGLAKPDPRFFLAILSMIGREPGATLFIDDHEANVEGARNAGLHAEWHDRTTGAGDLARILDAYGVRH